MSRSLRVLGRRQVAALLAAVLVVTGLVVLRAQSAAADTRTTTLTAICPIVDAVSVAVTATDTPDPAVAGGAVTLDILAGAPDFGVDDPVTSIVVVLPMPAQVAAVTSVTFTGGNVAGEATVAPDASGIRVVFTGPVPASALVLPLVTVAATIATDAAGQTVEWPGPSSLTLTIPPLSPITCDAAPTNPSIQSTAIETGPTTTTTSTTTSTSTTSTTAPTTTTTGSTTTTTEPTTTTTSSTTTTRPRTTTTKPRTTTTKSHHHHDDDHHHHHHDDRQRLKKLIRLLRWLLCHVFDVC